MNVSLDEYIREGRSKNNKMAMSLDEYIHMKNFNSAQRNDQFKQSDSGLSKFDRYKHQDEDDDMDDDSFPKEMPKLVPYEPKKMPKKPIHERLGNRESICESIHTSRMKLFRPNNFKAKHSVQSRLGKGWVNPAIRERGRIALHALTSFSKNMLASDDVQGQMLLNEFTKAIQGTAEPAKKYDMNVQKEISSLQGKELHYTCPGAFVISSDGPGLRGMVKIPTHKTGMSMNQRFA